MDLASSYLDGSGSSSLVGAGSSSLAGSSGTMDNSSVNGADIRIVGFSSPTISHFGLRPDISQFAPMQKVIMMANEIRTRGFMVPLTQGIIILMFCILAYPFVGRQFAGWQLSRDR